MKDYLTKSQKIKATCIVRHKGKILLFRGTEVTNPEHKLRGGYFDIPRFTVSFGEDPRMILESTLREYLGGEVDVTSMLDVRQYLSSNKTTQIFEVLFTASTRGYVQSNGCLGKYIFVEEDELNAYMFPQEIMYIKKYL